MYKLQYIVREVTLKAQTGRQGSLMNKYSLYEENIMRQENPPRPGKQPEFIPLAEEAGENKVYLVPNGLTCTLSSRPTVKNAKTNTPVWRVGGGGDEEGRQHDTTHENECVTKKLFPKIKPANCWDQRTFETDVEKLTKNVEILVFFLSRHLWWC